MALFGSKSRKKKKSRNPRGEMPFLDHLEELRWRILWAGLAVVVGTGVGIWLVISFDVIALLLEPLWTTIENIQVDNPTFQTVAPDGKLIFTSPTEPLFFMIKLGVMFGLVLASPIVVYQIWAFLSPAMEKREKRVIVPSLFFGLFLFAAGVALAYFIALPVSLRFLFLIGNEWFSLALTGKEYLSFVVRLLFAFGIIFELPVVVMILSALGIVTPAGLRHYRRHAIVAITILASFLSPGDVIAVTLLLMVPLILLYEVSILLSVVIYRKKDEEPTIHSEPPEGSVGSSRPGGARPEDGDSDDGESEE